MGNKQIKTPKHKKPPTNLLTKTKKGEFLMKTKIVKRVLSSLLCIALLFSVATVGAFAAETKADTNASQYSVIGDSIQVDAFFMVRPSYNAYQGTVRVRCPYATAIEVNGVKAEGTELMLYPSSTTLDQNPYYDMDITIYMEDGTFTTSKSLYVYDYMSGGAPEPGYPANIESLISVDAHFMVRPGYNAYQGNVTVSCPEAVAIAIGDVKTEGTSATGYFESTQLDQNPNCYVPIKIYLENGVVYQTSRTLNVYDYMTMS